MNILANTTNLDKTQDSATFLSGRQKPLDYDIPDETIENWISLMLSYLGGEAWLSKHKNHPISRLWYRKDAMSTNELVTFARAISIMESVDKTWLKKTMKLAISDDLNNAHGAIFEILALTFFKDAKFIVSPSSMGCPGIDGTTRIRDDGLDINLSLKYYGVSKAEQNFLAFMEEIDTTIKDSLHFSSADVRLSLNKCPETKADKDKIRELVKSAMKKYNKIAMKDLYDSQKDPKFTDDFAEMSIRPIEGFRISNMIKSHQFIAISPTHRNDDKNISDKIDDACRNLVKAQGNIANSSSTDDRINGIIIHLPENADMALCKEQAQNYLNKNLNAQIDFIILYQVYIAFYNDGKHGILHCIQFAVAPRTANLIVKYLKIKDRIIPAFSFFAGTLTFEPSKRRLIINQDRDATQQIELDKVYLYQKGEIYEAAYKDSDGRLGGDVKMLAPGIRLNAVFTIKDKHGKNVYTSASTPIPESDHMEIL